MFQYLRPVGTHKVETTAIRAYPFSVGTIHGYRTHRHVSQEIVGIVCPVVARNFHLQDSEVGIKPVVRIFHDEKTVTGSHPYLPVLVLSQSIDTIQFHTYAILIGAIGTIAEHVVVITSDGAVVVQTEQTGRMV